MRWFYEELNPKKKKKSFEEKISNQNIVVFPK